MGIFMRNQLGQEMMIFKLNHFKLNEYTLKKYPKTSKNNVFYIFFDILVIRLSKQSVILQHILIQIINASFSGAK